MSIDDFQTVINKGTDSTRYNLWSNHREVVTSLFDEVIKIKNQVKRIGIFGAGNCDDLNLEYLTAKCEEVVLFDIDLSSMKKSVNKLELNIRNKIKLVKVDLTNLESLGFYDEFERIISEKQNVKKVIKYLIAIGNKVKANNGVLEEYSESCDIVAFSGHRQ